MAVTIVQNQVLEVPFSQTYKADATGRFLITGQYAIVYRQVSVMVATKGPIGIALTISVEMSCSGGPSGVVGEFPNGDGLVHTYPMVGSSFSVYATGAIPNSTIPLYGWVFLN